jgi:hypothetical protein
VYRARTSDAALTVHGGRTAQQAHVGVIIRTLGVSAAGAALCLVLAGAIELPGGASPELEGGTGIARRGGAAATNGALARNQGASEIRQALAVAPDATSATPPDSGGRDAGWIEGDFGRVTVLDGRTLSTGALTLRLAGLELPRADEICRTLDSRLEQCAARAATQLELLTRSRTLACRYRMVTSSEAVGACRIAGHDIAERMLRTGYMQRAEGGGAIVLAGTAPN